jgi:hypothetical protein
MLPVTLCHVKNICHAIWTLSPTFLFYQCQYIIVKNSNMLYFKISPSAWNMAHEKKKKNPTNLMKCVQTTLFFFFTEKYCFRCTCQEEVGFHSATQNDRSMPYESEYMVRKLHFPFFHSAPNARHWYWVTLKMLKSMYFYIHIKQ